MTPSTDFVRRFGLLLAVAAVAMTAAGAEGEATALLRARVGRLVETGSIEVRGVVLGREDILPEFYARRGYEPGWTDPARIEELLGVLAASPTHGLDPRDFFLPQLLELSRAAREPAERADLDLLLTEALIRYGYQRRFGKVNPAEMEPAWNFGRGFASGVEPVSLLQAAIESPSLTAFLDEKVPGGPWYRQFRDALARYRGIAASGGWPAIPAGATLRPGDSDPRIPALRARLKLEGLLPALPPAGQDGSTAFDEETATALQVFQERHALAADGVLGAATLEALNLPAATRVEQLRMSLERVRWLTGDVPDTYVVVNVAGFRVGFVRDGRPVWVSRVVVGRAARQTPIFRGDMTYLELNPSGIL